MVTTRTMMALVTTMAMVTTMTVVAMAMVTTTRTFRRIIIFIIIIPLLSIPITTIHLLSPPIMLLMHPSILPTLIIIRLFSIVVTPPVPSSVTISLLSQGSSVGFPFVMKKVFLTLVLKFLALALRISLCELGQAS